MKTETMGTTSNSGSSSDYTAACEGRLRGWHRTATNAAQSFSGLLNHMLLGVVTQQLMVGVKQ